MSHHDRTRATRRRRVIVVVMLAALSALLVACGGGDESSSSTSASRDDGKLNLKIGFSGALTGSYASSDQPLYNGMKFAADQINKAGGPVSVEVLAEDNQGTQNLTATTTQELLDQGVRAFVLTTADPSVASGQLIAQAGGLSTLGANTAPQLVEDIGPTSMMVVFGDNVQASAAAQYACDQGYRSAYVLGSPEIPYTKEMPGYFEDAFKHCGGTVSDSGQYKIGQTEYAAQVTKIKNASPAPDVIFTPMFVPDLGAFMKQLRSVGVTTPVVTSDGADTQLLVDSGGKSVDGNVFTTHAFPKPGSQMAAFVEDFTADTGKAPESNTTEAIGRDNVYFLVAAAEAARSTDPEKMLEAALSLENVDLVTGRTTLDPTTRIANKEVTLVEMKGTEFRFLDKFKPSYVAQP